MSMTRDEAIRWFTDTRAGGLAFGDKQVAEASDMAITALQEQEKFRWIPVAERLPDLIPCGAGSSYSEAVNVLTSGRKVLTAIWDGTEFIADADFWDAEGEDITHWTPVLLPLPDPQKEARI